MKYKYQLDSSSKKDVCPQCRKRRFVRMIDELGNYLSAEFGRCDRSNSCGYYKSPQNSDSYVKLDFTLPNVVNLTRNVGPPSTIPHSYVEKSQQEYEVNSFYIFLSGLYNEQDILRVFSLYKVGTSKKWDGATVFWQISIENQVRTAKVIKYNANTGKRIKQPHPLMTWAHKLLNLKEFNLKQFFDSTVEWGSQTATVMLLVASSMLLGEFLTMEQIPQKIASSLTTLTQNKYLILAILNLFLFIIGFFLHSAAAIILVVPVVMPLINSLGIDPVHFGIIVTLNLAIGQQTPPVASVLAVACSIAKVDMWTATKVNIIFISVLIFILLLCTYVPVVPMSLVEYFYR